MTRLDIKLLRYRCQQRGWKISTIKNKEVKHGER